MVIQLSLVEIHLVVPPETKTAKHEHHQHHKAHFTRISSLCLILSKSISSSTFIDRSNRVMHD